MQINSNFCKEKSSSVLNKKSLFYADKDLPMVITSPSKNQEEKSFLFLLNKDEKNMFLLFIKIRAGGDDSCQHKDTSDLKKQLLSSLEQIKNFKQNWDGFGASRFNSNVIKNSYGILKKLFNSISDIQDVYLMPESNGTIDFQILYENKNIKETVISIGKSYLSSYSKYESEHLGIMFNSSIEDCDFLFRKLSNAMNGLFEYTYTK